MRTCFSNKLLPLVLALAGGLLLSSCAASYQGREDSSLPIDLSGSYQGSYWITVHEGSSEQHRRGGSVWMRFADGHYEVGGEQRLLPPSGSGDYRVEGDLLYLTDTAAHTADFDWTLILQGRFEIQTGNGGVIRFVQHDLDHSRLHELELRREG